MTSDTPIREVIAKAIDRIAVNSYKQGSDVSARIADAVRDAVAALTDAETSPDQQSIYLDATAAAMELWLDEEWPEIREALRRGLGDGFVIVPKSILRFGTESQKPQESPEKMV